MYLTHDEYLEFGGNIEDETLYNRHEYRARMMIDLATLGRVNQVIAERESVKRCMYELIEKYEQERQQEASGIGVTSVSNDGVSVSYGDSGSVLGAVNKICTEVIRMYLGNECTEDGMPLLYKGV